MSAGRVVCADLAGAACWTFIGAAVAAIGAAVAATALKAQAVAARTSGLFEPRVDLGSSVKKGDVIGLVHPIDDLSTDPEEVKVPQSGILFQRRASSRIEAGDRAGMVASELKP